MRIHDVGSAGLAQIDKAAVLADAVTTLLGVAAGELDEDGLAVWLWERAEKALG